MSTDSKPARRLSSHQNRQLDSGKRNAFSLCSASMRFYSWHHCHDDDHTDVFSSPSTAEVSLFGDGPLVFISPHRLHCLADHQRSTFTCCQATFAVHPSSSVCFLSPSRRQSDSTDTHSRPSTLWDNRAGWNRALPLPCTAARMHSLPQLKWEFEKPDVHLSSIPSELPPPSPPGICFFPMTAAFSISSVQEHAEAERQDGDARFLHSEVPASLPPFSLAHLRGAFSPSHLYTRRLLASASIRCSVKVNSWHLISTSWCFISCLFRESKNPVSCTNVHAVQFRQVWTDTSQSSDWSVSMLSSWNSWWWMAATHSRPKQCHRCCRSVAVPARHWARRR